MDIDRSIDSHGNILHRTTRAPRQFETPDKESVKGLSLAVALWLPCGIEALIIHATRETFHISRGPDKNVGRLAHAMIAYIANRPTAFCVAKHHLLSFEEVSCFFRSILIAMKAITSPKIVILLLLHRLIHLGDAFLGPKLPFATTTTLRLAIISRRAPLEADTTQQDTFQLIGLVIHSVCVALTLIAWENLTYSHCIGRRVHHAVVSATTTTRPLFFGAGTVGGMAFGASERQLLQSATPLSYNEVLQQHRTRVVREWHTPPTEMQLGDAVHALVQALMTLSKLKEWAKEYQWDRILPVVKHLQNQIGQASSALRWTDTDGVVGFDWGSCAWRHCGAWADAVEALDELDARMGLLEPPEVAFCLDVVERSVRDMLMNVNWREKWINKDDVRDWQSLDEYIPWQSSSSGIEGGSLDDYYLKALSNLRID